MSPPQNEPRLVPRTYISRPRLLEKISLASQYRLAVVCANAGYGKTTLLTEFANSTSLRTEWHHLTAADRDIARLADALDNCLRRLAATSERHLHRRTRPRQATALSTASLCDALLVQAARVGRDTVLLILDDYQAIDQESDANSLLASLIENSPSTIHFVIPPVASRGCLLPD